MIEKITYCPACTRIPTSERDEEKFYTSEFCPIHLLQMQEHGQVDKPIVI